MKRFVAVLCTAACAVFSCFCLSGCYGKTQEGYKYDVYGDDICVKVDGIRYSRKKGKNATHFTISGFYEDGCYDEGPIDDILTEIDGLPVTELENLAGNHNVKSITIPEGIESIGKQLVSAFGSDTALETLVLPDSLKSIVGDAFYGCKSLKSIVIPKNVTRLSNNGTYGMFRDCYKLKSVTLPGGIKKIPKKLFIDCSLTDVTLGEGIESIGEEAFWYNGFEYIDLPASLKKIEKNAFEKCENLTLISFPSGMEEVGEGAFSNCKALKTIIINNKNMKLHSRAFSIQSFTVSNISEVAFAGTMSEWEEFKTANSLKFPPTRKDITVECDDGNVVEYTS